MSPQAYDTVASAFPGDPRLQLYTIDVARAFAVPAMQRLWKYGSDSMGPAPLKTPIDTDRFIKRYLPAPESVPPRRFTLADPYGEHPDAPRYVWLDSNFREVPEPQE